MSGMFILIDIGGTKIRFAGSHVLHQFSEPLILDSPQQYEEGVSLIARVARNIAGTDPIEGVAIGVPAVLSEDRRSVLKTPPHHADWIDRPLADDVETLLEADAYIENDTALVGLGEAVFGAGKGASIVAYMTISTGVNGVRIVDGMIDHTLRGFEVGGQYLDGDNTLEELVSGTAIEGRFGVHPKELGMGHPVWEELAIVLAYGVHNSILHWSPEIFILGGSMMNEVGIPVERVGSHVRDLMQKLPDVPPIVHSSLGDVGGLWGGLARLRATR